MLRLLYISIQLFLPALLLAQHPVTFFTGSEAALVKSNLKKYPLLTRSFQAIKSETDVWIGKDVDVPFPKDPAGGYTHDKHKLNYMLMFNSGVLYNVTGDSKYAKLVKDILLKYAALNPTLPNHPQATSNSPGRIFWQALNDANWLVYTGMAYDLVYNYLTAAERKKIETGAFKPEVDYLTKDLNKWFNLIHNHGVWACAGVGIVGIATGNTEWVNMALYGTDKKGKSGFIAQMDGLFSPDGYYTEGPYYVRYAILPYYLFANAIQNSRPELKIFNYRDRILYKALQAALQQSNTDGRFFAFNDALKEKDYTSNELITAVGTAWSIYGRDSGLLVVAKKQDRVLLNKGGVLIAEAIANKNVPQYYPYRTVEYADGVKGDEGGISILRSGKGNNLTTLLFKYTAHGLSHGHYDKLAINLYDKGNEVLTDYGAVRFIGVEQKYGGRYLPETKNFASQTITHNTLTVDEKSHFGGKENEAEKFHSEKLFSSIESESLKVVSAIDRNAYGDVGLHRSVYMLSLPGMRTTVIDIFHAVSKNDHQYDLPFHYNGQLISTSVKYDAHTSKMETLGLKNGYQFFWKEATGKVTDSIAQFTFLNNNTYYSVSSLVEGNADIFFTRTGANDPNFNIRREPAFVIRKKGRKESFASVIEIHGRFDPIGEFSSGSYSSLKKILFLVNDENYTVAEIVVDGKKIIIAQSNNDVNNNSTHTAGKDDSVFKWKGPYTVIVDGKEIKN